MKNLKMITIYKDDMLKLCGKHGSHVVFKGLPFNDDIGGMGFYLMISTGSKINYSSFPEVTNDHMEFFKLLRAIISNRVNFPGVSWSQNCKVEQGMIFNEYVNTCHKNGVLMVPRIVFLAFTKRNFSILHFLLTLFVIWCKSVFCNKERKQEWEIMKRSSQ